MTPYTKLQMHLERHMYKRGQYKGQAPADRHSRGKNHFRVLRGNDGKMCVRMYNTDLISVTEGDRITISMGGWWTSTTRQNLNYAMREFLGWGAVGSQCVFSCTQTVIRANRKTYHFYDGMEFDVQGNLLSLPARFERRQTDREATKEFREDMAECGFKDVWPVLFAAAEPMRSYGQVVCNLRNIVTHELHANSWGDVAAHYKMYFDDHKAALRAIVRTCTSDMKVTVRTDVTVL